jgi:RNA polymerase subunit RPABC4/transcription elongation factor Spt4/DNA-directed RNA polymerase subunit RPC12/RpoP
VALRDVACEDCNMVLPMEISSFNQDKPNVWYPGKKCPMCGSEKFYPVIAITETDRQQALQQVSLKRRLLLNPWTGVAAFIVTIIVVLAIVFLPRHAGESSEKALFFCEKCHALFFARNSLPRPVKCPECGERAGHRAATCVRCHLVYSYGQKKCPHCGSTSCTPLMTLEEAAQAMKDHEKYLKLEQEMVEGDGSEEE